jgi:hypothetical protein
VGNSRLAAFFERTNRMATVQTGMQQTLENLKLAVEYDSP